MKKSILAVAGVAAFAGVAMPFAGASALTTSQEDTIKVTIDSNCTLRDVSHTAGTGSAATSWGSSDNTLTGKMTNGTMADNYGSTTMGVTCNSTTGSHVSVSLADLSGSGTNKIAASTSLSSSTSGWAVKSSAIGNTPWQTSGDVWTKSSPVDSSESTFTVTYGVGVSTTQQADTYTGTATYTLSNISS